MGDSKQIDAGEVVRLLWLAVEGKLDTATIRDVIGEAKVTSLTEVGRVFGVAPHTVRHTWKPNGMPSVGKRGSGSEASLTEILIWAMARNEKNRVARGSTEFTQLLNELELRKQGAVVRIQERKADVVEGEYILVDSAIAVVRSRAGLFRDRLMGIGRVIKPMLPAKYAAQCIEEIERFLRGQLTSFAESSLRDLEDLSQERTKENV